jgi:hypothetical protein
MKGIIIVLLTIIVFNCHAQKIFSDKKDPFTNERHIQTNNSILSPILQVGGMVSVGDSSKAFYLSFITPAIPAAKVKSVDSLKRECMIKTSSGVIIKGKWFGNVEMPIGAKFYNSYTYTFTQADYKEISAAKITNIKTDQGLFEIDQKNGEKVPRLCGILLSKIQ